MHDGITFEKSGKRAVVLCTEPFEVTLKNIARSMGQQDYPFVLLPHPLGSLPVDKIQTHAETASQAAVKILTNE